MTAVEWFYQRMFAKDINAVFKQAKEMEKQEKHSEYMRGWKDGLTKQTFKNTKE